MSLLSDLRVLYHLTLHPIRGATHAQRLEAFYAGQAADYDRFRARLLPGRADLFNALPWPAGGVWVDLGAGSGSNLRFAAPHVPGLRQAYLVDLAPSLLQVASRRIQEAGWPHVATVEADATTFRPPEGSADLVTLSYALTMMPDWFAVLDHARALLRPGGVIGVVDFHVSRKYAAAGTGQHGWWTRHFWPAWFGMDNVWLSPDHVPYLRRHFEPLHYSEHGARVPYLPLGRVPTYRFIGRKV